MKNLVVLIDGNRTNIPADKLAYFQDVLGAELVDYTDFEEVEEKQPRKQNNKKKNK